MKRGVWAIIILLLFANFTFSLNALTYFHTDTKIVHVLGEINLIDGDWIVNTTEVRSNETIILNGNLTIQAGGNLTFRNVTLKMNCSFDGEYHIELHGEGEFYVYDNDWDNTTAGDASVITAVNSNYEYLFWVLESGRMIMKNSELHECGYYGDGGPYWFTNYGLCILSNYVIIDHSFVSDNCVGIFCYNSSPIITNNTITLNTDDGIWCREHSTPLIANNTIMLNNSEGAGDAGIVCEHNSNATITNNIISYSDGGIVCQFGASPTISNNIISLIWEDGIGCLGDSSPRIIDTTFLGNEHGFVCTTSCYPMLINCSITGSLYNDLEVYGGSHLTVINTSFNKSKVALESDGKCDLTVQNYLDVYVNNTVGNPVPSATVRVVDSENGTFDENYTTGFDGYVHLVNCTEYVQTATNITYYTPHTVYAEKYGVSNSTTVYMNESKDITLTLDLPSIIPTNLSLTSTSTTLTADGTSTSKITATVTNETGTPVKNATINFTIENGSGNLLELTNITDSNGIATATYVAGTIAGDVIINVSCDSIWNKTTIILLPGSITEIKIIPEGQINLYVNDTCQFTVAAYDQYGNLNTSWQPYWHVEGNIGTINETGFFKATKKGSDAVNCTDNTTGVYNISIVNVLNSMPIIETIENQTAYEGQLFTLQINATDPDEDILTFSDNSTLFDINSTTGVISFVPDYDSTGIYLINITVTDGDALVWRTFKLTIINVNRSPVISSYSPETNPTITEEECQTFNITASDPDEYTVLIISWYLNDTLVPISMDTVPSYTFEANYTSAGWYEVKVIVSDGVLSVEHIWILTVTNVNRAPIITEYYPTTDQIINETENITFTINAFDPDGDNIYYYWYMEEEIVVGETNNSFTFYTNYSSVGNHTIKVIVSDGELVANHTWNLTVLNVNQRPNIDSYSPLTNQTILDTQTQTFSVNASDLDNDNLTYLWYLNESLVLENETVYTFVPDENSSGNHTVKVIVSDGNLSVSHTWTVTVINVGQLQQTINELQNQLNQSIANYTALQAIITQLNDNLSSVWNQLNGSLGNNTELKNIIGLISQNLTKIWNVLNQSLSNNTALQSVINQLNNTLNSSAAQISALWAQLNQSSINETALRNQISGLNENITNLQEQIAQLGREKEQAESEREQSIRESWVIIGILLAVVVAAWVSAGLVKRKKV